MYKSNVVCRPPDSDSEEDYDGFYFGDDHIKKDTKVQWKVDEEQGLYEAVINGDLKQICEQIKLLEYNVDKPVMDGLTLLQHACREGHLHVVEHLLEQLGADTNKQIDSFTPLMFACECNQRETHFVEKIVQLLLQHNAVINVSDKYGTTPFMRACMHGHTAVVRLMLKEVSFDAVDNQGCTPIFHAIEHNRADIVRLLVDAGVNVTIANRKGYTPMQVAQFHGFYDLLEILPQEPRDSGYLVPTQFLAYNTLRDYIPRIFLKSECPEYFQEINTILMSIGMEKFLEHFAKERVTLAQFLCMQDGDLAALGIEYPIQRMKILKGLLDFHLHHWSMKCIARVSKSSKENFYEILMITANHLQHLVVINSTLRYVNGHLRNGTLGILSPEQLQQMQRNLHAYRTALRDLHRTVKYLASFSPPKNPLYIDYDEYLAERKRNKFKRYFKYTTIFIGVSVFICLKVKRLF